MNGKHVIGFRGVLWVLLGMVMVLSGMAPVEGSAAEPAHRVVMHVNAGEARVHQGLLNNIRHLYEEVGAERLRVEVVAHGAGLALLTRKDTTVSEQLARLKEQYGVEYTACSNTMKAQGLARADLVDEVDRTIPAMVRLMELQEQGWVYIKP